MHLIRAFAIAVLLGLAALGARAELATFDVATLTIDTKGGPQHFKIEMALTPQQQEQGLMYRKSLAPDAGMLFVFPKTQTATFWMKNTLIPLDMLFVAADGRIVGIHADATPLSTAPITVGSPSRWVVEVPGGFARRSGIATGDRVELAGVRLP